MTRKNILGILAGCLVLLLLLCGCSNHDKEDVQVQPPVVAPQEEYVEQVDIEKLEEEYLQILDLMDEVFMVVSDYENLTMNDITSLIKYIADNRVEPTQKLTKELNDLAGNFMKLCINYSTADENRKIELEEELINVFQQIEEKMFEIENTINNVDDM